MTPRVRFALLAAILAVATALRFAGLANGLRHTPFIDEQFFVANVEGMLQRGDLDPQFHMYPGFLFMILKPILWFLPRPFGAEAYLVTRQVVAAFGVATAVLVYALGARLGSARVGLLAAAILAVSPVAVTVAHEVRPDVVLGFFAMVALLLIARIDGDWKRDVLAGLGIGMATAIKFTGVALVFAYVARRATLSSNRWRGMLLAGAVSFATYAVLSPYSFLHFDDFVEGVTLQKSYHDELRGRGPQGYITIALVYLWNVLPGELGGAALIAALIGLWVTRKDWRATLPLIVLPLALIIILSTAQIHRNRYLLPGLGGLAVLAGLALDSLLERSRGLGIAATLLVIGLPLIDTTLAVAAYRRPNTMDRVLDWANANLKDGSRIATNLPRLGFGVGRFEVVPVDDWDTAGRRVADNADVVIAPVTADRAAFPGFVRRFVAQPQHPLEGPFLEVLTRVAPHVITTMNLDNAQFDASENGAALSLLNDGDLNTRWQTEGTQQPGMWMQITLPAARTIDSIEFSLGARPNQWGRHVEVTLSQDGQTWMPVRIISGRAQPSEQVATGGGHTQLLLLVEPALARGVRVRIAERGEPRWGIAEVSLRSSAVR